MESTPQDVIGYKQPNLDPTVLSAKNVLVPTVLHSVVLKMVDREKDLRIPR